MFEKLIQTESRNPNEPMYHKRLKLKKLRQIFMHVFEEFYFRFSQFYSVNS